MTEAFSGAILTRGRDEVPQAPDWSFGHRFDDREEGRKRSWRVVSGRPRPFDQ